MSEIPETPEITESNPKEDYSEHFYINNLTDEEIETLLCSMSSEELLRFDRIMSVVLDAESDDEDDEDDGMKCPCNIRQESTQYNQDDVLKDHYYSNFPESDTQDCSHHQDDNLDQKDDNRKNDEIKQ